MEEYLAEQIDLNLAWQKRQKRQRIMDMMGICAISIIFKQLSSSIHNFFKKYFYLKSK